MLLCHDNTVLQCILYVVLCPERASKREEQDYKGRECSMTVEDCMLCFML
jgi:hypothetical protein